ncbi:MAG TPA: PHP-associated domain-containing protein [Candidatus Dormibacteraeota bacterium]|nr:PHP-associated domain-containing protein [Candidatus Dormibacteraeota bacterium]
MGKADMHIHTSCNDGTATVVEILDFVRDSTDLDVIAITDHDRLRGAQEAVDRSADYPFEIVPGVEMTTLEGHCLCLFVQQPIKMWRSLEWTIGKAHEQGAIVIAPHPMSMLTRSIGRWSFERVMKSKSAEIYFDAVETLNPSYAGRVAEPRVRALNQERWQLPEVGNSDAHHREGVGSAYTIFDGTTAAEYRSALTRHATRAEGEHWDLGTHALVARRKLQSLRNNLVQGPRHMLRRLATESDQ